MFVFHGTYAGKSKKDNKPYWQVNLFEKRANKDNEVYFKATTVFVDEDVHNKIVKQGFRFGDVVELEKGAPLYFGGAEVLKGLKLVSDTPYFD